MIWRWALGSWRSNTHALITLRKKYEACLYFLAKPDLVSHSFNIMNWTLSDMKQQSKSKPKKEGEEKEEEKKRDRDTVKLQHSPLCFNTEVCPWACCQRRVPWQRSTGNTKLINPHEASFSNRLEEWLYYSKKNWKVLDMSSNWLCTVTVLHTPTCCK